MSICGILIIHVVLIFLVVGICFYFGFCKVPDLGVRKRVKVEMFRGFILFILDGKVEFGYG